MKRYISLLLLFVCGLLQAQTLTVDVPNVVATGEPFRVVFTADGKISDFEWAPSGGLTLMWGPSKGSSSSTTIINGKVESSRSETYTYLLSADTKGTYTIPAAPSAPAAPRRLRLWTTAAAPLPAASKASRISRADRTARAVRALRRSRTSRAIPQSQGQLQMRISLCV